MGTLSLTDLREEVTASLGNRDDLSTARIDRAINIAQMQIARMHRWKELNKIKEHVPSLSGNKEEDRYVGIPNIRDIYSFMVLDTVEEKAKRLVKRTQSWWDTYITASNYFEVGHPEHYIEWQGMYEVFPVFDSSHSYKSVLRCCVWPTDLTQASVASELDRKDDLILAGANSYLFTTLRMLDDAARWFTIYRDRLTAAVMEETTEPDLQIQAFKKYQDSTLENYWADPFSQIQP